VQPAVGISLRSLVCVTLLLIAASTLLAPTPVRAADAAEAEAAEAHPVEGPITMHKQDVDLAIFTLITFGIFLFVLKKMAWKPLIEGLDKREGKIQAALSDAEHARIKAQKLLDDHQHKLDRVQDQVREILAEARRDAEVTKNDIITTAQREAELSKNRALVEIQRAKDAALDELFDQMSGTVTKATQQVVGRSLSGADHERLIREALQEFSSRKA
jgi:F-type H+-transporting ATPase subunit b